MTIKVERVTINRQALREIMRSEGMQELLGRKGLAVADRVEAAGIRVEGVPGRIPLPVTVTVHPGRSRARARVILDHPAGLAVEAKHRILGSSVDAARTA